MKSTSEATRPREFRFEKSFYEIYFLCDNAVFKINNPFVFLKSTTVSRWNLMLWH